MDGNEQLDRLNILYERLKSSQVAALT